MSQKRCSDKCHFVHPYLHSGFLDEANGSDKIYEDYNWSFYLRQSDLCQNFAFAVEYKVIFFCHN